MLGLLIGTAFAFGMWWSTTGVLKVYYRTPTYNQLIRAALLGPLQED